MTGQDDGSAWLSGLAGPPAAQAPAPGARSRQTRAQVFEEKKEHAQRVNEERVRPGTCPRCGTVVMYGRYLGLLDVVDAVPVQIDATWEAVANGAGIYMVFNNKLKRVTGDARGHFNLEYVHVEHVSCGKAVPIPIDLPKPPKHDVGDVPPFDGMKRWRCWDCREIIEPSEQGIVISYDGEDMSYYLCHCAKTCEPVKSQTKLKAKVKYPKVNKLTGRYEEPKKGEVLPNE